MILCILGRQPQIGLAELECVFGADALTPFSHEAALVDAEQFSVERFGSIIKAGVVVAEFSRVDWRTVSTKIIQHYSHEWRQNNGKQTLGISVYGTSVAPRDVQKLGIVLKSRLKAHGVSLRLIPNQDQALSSATSHHNKLGLAPNKTELLIAFSKNKVVVAESLGAQNITALAARDQGRPKRDAFVGMLPPKLALTMVNLANDTNNEEPANSAVSFSEDSAFPAAGPQDKTGRQLARPESEEKDDSGVSASTPTILDPFCGTGVLLQEAALLGYNVYGTDLSEKMVDYSLANLEWAKQKYRLSTTITIHHGDAIETKWQQPIDAIASETYLGQPFSAPPSPTKLTQVRGNCNEIIKKFLTNLAPQIEKGIPLCLAVPAWRDAQGRFAHLPLISRLEELGYQPRPLRHVRHSDLIYYREDQVVARQLLLLTRS